MNGVIAPSHGSIPACAGKPITGPTSAPRETVYPRVCGETPATLFAASASPGLSPRVRGNRRAGTEAHSPWRSIPACAGKPLPKSRSASATRVYPRVCGETEDSNTSLNSRPGLSPRVRGNRATFAFSGALGGSIPACAGKPSNARQTCRPGWVYPRVCGETAPIAPDPGADQGLSPRVRGNLRLEDPDCGNSGSIPACAGKPKW